MASGINNLNIRQSAVAGSFYPQEKNELKLLLEKFFKNTKRIEESKNIRALIVPHAGLVYSGQTAAWGYNQLPKKQKSQHFVLIGPSHSFYFQGMRSSSSSFWITPFGQVKQQMLKVRNRQIKDDETVHANEHCLEVQLPFLQYLYHSSFFISSFLTGINIDFEDAQNYFIKNFPTSIFIISSDLSHYLPMIIAEKKDKKTLEAILHQDENYLFYEENIACGLAGISLLLKIAQKKRWKSKLVYYDTSDTASKDESTVVGYASLAFYEK